MPRGRVNRKYTPEFKKQVVETRHNEHLGYRETATRFQIRHKQILDWERIYLVEGPEGLTVERRGRGSKGRPKEIPKEAEEDLLAEVQRLRAENDGIVKKSAHPTYFIRQSDSDFLSTANA